MFIHFGEAFVKGGDQRLLARVQRLQPMRCFGRIAAVILGHVPIAGRYFSQETLHFLGIGNQLAIEMAWVPIDQHAAEIEDDDRGPRRGYLQGQNWAFSWTVFEGKLASKISQLKLPFGCVFCWYCRTVLLVCETVSPTLSVGPKCEPKTR